MALCIPAVGESYDCAKAAISLERSNSFPWPEDCVQIHQTLFHRRTRGWGLGTRLVATHALPYVCIGGQSSIYDKIISPCNYHGNKSKWDIFTGYISKLHQSIYAVEGLIFHILPELSLE